MKAEESVKKFDFFFEERKQVRWNGRLGKFDKDFNFNYALFIYFFYMILKYNLINQVIYVI